MVTAYEEGGKEISCLRGWGYWCRESGGQGCPAYGRRAVAVSLLFVNGYRRLSTRLIVAGDN